MSRNNFTAMEKKLLQKLIDNKEDINNMFDQDEFNISRNYIMKNNQIMNKSKVEENTKPTSNNRSVFCEKQKVPIF